jgi:peptidoglycan lytic transglycosylase
MQTKLRIGSLLFVASLLWTSPTSAATQKAKLIKAANVKLKYTGTASWYGKQHQGRKMANGKRFDRNKLTAASWYFPLGTTVRVVNLKNGKSVVVTITDRGPNHRLNRSVDLSEAAAARLGYVRQGLTPVFLYPVVAVTTEPAELDSHLTGPDSDKRPVAYVAKALNTPN